MACQGIDERIFFDIVEKFGKVEKVKLVLVRRYREEVRVSVIVLEDRYDSELRDKFLDIEYEVRQSFSNVVFQFFYLPFSSEGMNIGFLEDKGIFVWVRR
jgi:hypothetical protein